MTKSSSGKNKESDSQKDNDSQMDKANVKTEGAVVPVPGTYDASSIKVLEGLEAVRRRPAMYIGSTSEKGLHHLVFEVVDNSIDEAMAGHCDQIVIKILPNGSVSVLDNGRGIPVDLHIETGKSALEVVLTTLHAGGKFDKQGYKVSGGLHGVGVSCVNALSEWMEVEVYREGTIWIQRYHRGAPQEDVKVSGKTKLTGTKTTFLPDSTIFETMDFKFEILARRFRELAFLTPGLEILFTDERAGQERTERFFYKGGLVAYIKHINRNQEPLFTQVFYMSKERDGVEVDVAIQYNTGFNDKILTYVNNINTVDGGTHLEGFKSALTRAINQSARKLGHFKDKNKNLSGDDVREGLAAIVSVRVPEPQFEGQTKGQLGNSEVKGIVDSAVYEDLTAFLEENPPVIKKIVQKGVQAQRARDAARHARDLTRKKSLLHGAVLAGKLAECSFNDPSKNELYLVEGDSAGGTAKGGRDRRFQAILPLRGKIINVEKARLDKILSNEEIGNLITAIGTSIDDEFNIDKLRYHRIIIMTDADIDGAHIRTLILTFFFRHLVKLIEEDHLYIAQPPLFQLKKGKQVIYALDAEDLKVKQADPEWQTGVSMKRYKGLGEMNDKELWETTMNPDVRKLLRVRIEDAKEADETFEMLMGTNVEPRKDFINEYAKRVEYLDI
jgi:DNA gyrase subunit B